VKTAVEVCFAKKGDLLECDRDNDGTVSAALAGSTGGLYVNTVSATAVDADNLNIVATGSGSGLEYTYRLNAVDTAGDGSGDNSNLAIEWRVDEGNSTCYDQGICDGN
jgi:hypothetical protein